MQYIIHESKLLLVKLGSLNHADVWNLTGGGLLTL